MYRLLVPISVLLVEDDPDLAFVMSRALDRAGNDVVVANDGAAALEIILGSERVDVVVTDRGLPDMDGLRVVARMREHGFPGAVLVTSGQIGEDHEAACRAAGADSVLGKPFRLAELVERVDELATGRELVA